MCKMMSALEQFSLLQKVKPGNSLIKASLKRPVPDRGQLVTVALARAGVSHKEAALTMEISESLLSRQLRGKEHLSYQRLGMLPDKFWAELLILEAEARGLLTVTAHFAAASGE